jgi:hypothetical protein
MHAARIAAMLEPFLDPANGQCLTSRDPDYISTHIDILLRWNARINLTGSWPIFSLTSECEAAGWTGGPAF